MYKKALCSLFFVVMLIFSYNVHAAIFASGGEDGKIKIWDSETKKLVKELFIPCESLEKGRVTVLAFNEQCPVELVSGHVDGSLILWNIETGAYKIT